MAKRRMSTFERLKTGRMNRAERRDLGRRIAASDPKLAIVHVNAAGEVRFGITSGQDAADRVWKVCLPSSRTAWLLEVLWLSSVAPPALDESASARTGDIPYVRKSVTHCLQRP